MSRRSVTYTVQTRRRVGLGELLLHTILTVFTGGFWLVLLAIRYLIR